MKAFEALNVVYLIKNVRFISAFIVHFICHFRLHFIHLNNQRFITQVLCKVNVLRCMFYDDATKNKKRHAEM